MEDRELVELSAKAAGIKGIWHRKGFVAYSGWSKGIFNPLEDDGDAMRLAVKLNILLDVNVHYTRFLDLCVHDKFEATRRAITRAAAQISKEME